MGEKLKRLRSERRISLSEVSRFTHIQIKYLEYIELGDYDKLPADVYVKGFLKNYAEFLGIDSKILIKLFEKEKGIDRNIKKKNGDYSQKIFKPLNIKFFSITPKRIALILGVSSVLLILFLLYAEVVSFTNNPKLVVFNLEEEWETEDSSFQLEGVAEKDAKVFINGQSVLVYDNGDFKETLALQPGANYVEIKAINRFDKETKRNLTVFYKQEEVVEEVAEETGQAEEIEKMTLEVKVDSSPVWLEIESDGTMVFNGNMFAGAVQRFEAENEFKLSSGKADATWIKFGEEDFQQFSKEEGAIKDVVFNKESNN